MERKTVTLLGALAGAAALGSTSAHAVSPAAATPQEPLAAMRYADLLQPIPNAVEALKASNAELAERARNAPAKVEQADWGGDDDHHHHHHHHHEYYAPPPPYWGYYPPPPPVYHHHHHHHAGAVIVVPGIGIQLY